MNRHKWAQVVTELATYTGQTVAQVGEMTVLAASVLYRAMQNDLNRAV